MAPTAANGDSMAALEDIQAPSGIVLPPKEIKGGSFLEPQTRTLLTILAAILEKTAGYVARNGLVFEG
jgi:splicing factor 3A subunit 1